MKALRYFRRRTTPATLVLLAAVFSLVGCSETLDRKSRADAPTVTPLPAPQPERAARSETPLAPTPAADPKADSVAGTEPAEPRKPDVIFVPTPEAVVNRMLELAEVKPEDVVYDLGCGDGRIVVAAAKKYGVKAMGFDIDPQRVKEALENVRSNQVEHLVTIQQADIFTLDLRPASVVTLYLLPDLNVKLMPQLEKLRPGSRIVSHDFDMRGAKPVKTETVEANAGDYGNSHTIYKWVVPWVQE